MKADEGGATRARFRREVKSSTRATAISGTAIAVIGYPTWAVFDHLVEPSSADGFLVIRLLLTIPIAVALLALLFTRFGERHPELLMLGVMLTVNIGIALMLARVETHYAAYALGMSLTVYGGAFLLLWPSGYMAALCGLSLAILALILAVSDPIGTEALATVFFYFGSACILSFLGQLHRERAAWREFQSLDSLEREQRRSSELVAELNRISRQDSLTGLANRRAWDDALREECARNEREGSDFAVLLCDVDQLKLINDRLGHAVGDTVLRTVGRLLNEHSRRGDLIARLGGDEFAVLARGCELLPATELGEKLRRLVEAQTTAAAGIGDVTISVGVAHWEGGDDASETLMLRADRRLYTAKATRNVVCAGDPGRSR